MDSSWYQRVCKRVGNLGILGGILIATTTGIRPVAAKPEPPTTGGMQEVTSDPREPRRPGLSPDATSSPESPPRIWAVLLTGLPGDDEHARLFQQTAEIWHSWLVESLGVPARQILRLPAVEPGQTENRFELTAEGARTHLEDLQRRVGPEDALWVFTLGHGSYDGQRSWFHLAGRDPAESDLAGWLSDFRCREQVVWLTHSCSGWAVKSLSRPGRIVITASAADDEVNETEFPHAFAAVIRKDPGRLDVDHDGKLSVAELFVATGAEVERRFQSDGRLATEHAQLDDDGDGRGSETLDGLSADGAFVPFRIEGLLVSTVPQGDGQVASRTWIPDRRLSSRPQPAAAVGGPDAPRPTGESP